MDGYFIDGENNQIEIIENEKVSLLPRTQKIEGLFVRLTGSNNIIRLHKPFKFINSSIFVVDCKNAVVEIGENSACNTLVVRNNGGVNRNCYIGKNFSCWGCEILLNGRGNSVYVGDDCLFSKEIHIMNGDGHPLYVMGEEWKPQTDVRIGNNVWMGMGAWVLKNVSIADGCVIGAASVVTKSFYKKNSALAGNPAHVVKENIIWLRSPKR
jgi:acetyltransferase-like isoleucine patch superfamily enzyme